MALEKHIETIKNDFYQQLTQANSSEQLEMIRVEFLGRNGKIAQLMKSLASVSLNE